MSTSQPENRRRSVRKPHSIRAMLEQGGSCSLARIVSFSREGVGMTTDIHSLPRRCDHISLRFSNGRGDIIVHGEVRWSSVAEGKNSTFGVEFRTPGPDYTGFYDSLSG